MERVEELRRFPNYWVYEDGRVWSLKAKGFLPQRKTNGEVYYRMKARWGEMRALSLNGRKEGSQRRASSDV